MDKGRVEAFSDGVLAIIITIMVLELKTPDGVTIQALAAKLPVLLSYVFSFIMLGTYWNNHHHLFQITEKINGKIMWANLHLLFWLSLIPFTTSWLGENYSDALPVAAYGFVLTMSGFAYFILQKLIIKNHAADFALKKAIGADWKGKVSVILFITGTITSFANAWAAIFIYIFVLFMWFVPDKRIEKSLEP